MKRFASYILYTLLLAAVVCASFSSCNSDLDIKQDYPFDLLTMPVPKKVAKGETIEIRCQITKEGEYKKAKYYIRYFQPDGTGELKTENGTVLTPNDLFLLDNTVFRLYYTSHCKDLQKIDIYIEDSFGQLIQKSFSFQNDSPEEL